MIRLAIALFLIAAVPARRPGGFFPRQLGEIFAALEPLDDGQRRVPGLDQDMAGVDLFAWRDFFRNAR